MALDVEWLPRHACTRRNRAHAEQVALATRREVGPYPPERGSWDLLVNCTPVGMHPHVDETPIDADELTGRYVYDLVYNPHAYAAAARGGARPGARRSAGSRCWWRRPHEQFDWWTGVRPPAGVMREAALKRLAEFMRDENHVV